MVGVIAALVSGALMSIQGVFNTDVTKQTSLWVSASFVQFTALLVCLAAWLICDRTSFRSLFEISDKYVSGRCDWRIYYGNSYLEHEWSGACKGSHADCDFSAYCGMAH